MRYNCVTIALQVVITLREEIFTEFNFTIQGKKLRISRGNFECFAGFSFMVEQYITKLFCAEK